jgi:RsiW-degrading membrane proteinase PrsW (M82 family)
VPADENEAPSVTPVLDAERRVARRKLRAAELNPPLGTLRKFVYSARFVLRFFSFFGGKAVAPVLALAYLTGSQLVVAIAAAVTNAAVVLSWTWEVDHYEEEPWRLVAKTFLWGVLPAVVLAVIGEIFIHNYTAYLLGGAPGRPFQVGLVAPVVEEIAKGIVLIFLLHRHRHEFDGMVDGLLYGALVGIGFSMTENVFYYLEAKPEALESLIFVRGLLFGMNHAVFSACFGLGLGIARDSTDTTTRRIAPILGLSAAIALHMAHNLLVISSPIWAIPLGIGAALAWFRLVAHGRKREAKWIREGLTPELSAGLLTAKEISEISSVRNRMTTLRKILMTESTPGPAHHERRFYAVATELAFARHKAELEPGDHRYPERIARLRKLMIALRLHHPGEG